MKCEDIIKGYGQISLGKKKFPHWFCLLQLDVYKSLQLVDSLLSAKPRFSGHVPFHWQRVIQFLRNEFYWAVPSAAGCQTPCLDHHSLLMFLLLLLKGKAGHFFMSEVLPYRNINI